MTRAAGPAGAPATPTSHPIPAVFAVLTIALLSTMVGCGNTDDDRAEPGASTSPTETSSGATDTTWVAPADDPTQPSPAAVAADEAYRVAPANLLDCGVHVRTSGYPTTSVPGRDLLDCILDAAAAGTPAQFVSTARDFAGGMEGTIFRVKTGDEIVVIDYQADPQGAITSAETTCTTLVGTNFPIPECG